ncbi:MAG: G1 family glutamic endopeptidase [Pseudomonadota bacterium]
MDATTGAGGVFHPPAPPRGFDPVGNAADRARLTEFGLPPAPDAVREPALHAHWATLFTPSMRFVSPEARPAVAGDCVLQRRRITALRRGGASPAARTFVSGNWSGGWIAANRGARFRAVAARWRVPAVMPGAAVDASAEPYRCSVWVGLDGKHAWAASMPQLGTEHTADPNGGHRFWWQWWVRDSTDMQHYVDGIPLSPDDEVLCYLAMLSTTKVVYCFANISSGKVAVAVVSKPASPMRGSTAEFILERPANGQVIDNKVITGNLFPMPDFGVVACDSFAASCVALDDPANTRPRGLQHCRMIQNGAVRSGPRRVGVTARAERFRIRDLAIRFQRAP